MLYEYINVVYKYLISPCICWQKKIILCNARKDERSSKVEKKGAQNWK